MYVSVWRWRLFSWPLARVDALQENWERFLPQFKKRSVKRRKVKVVKKKSTGLLLPEQTPRKEDLQLESGEYFLLEEERQRRKQQEKLESQRSKGLEKRRQKAAAYDPEQNKPAEAPAAETASEPADPVLALKKTAKKKKTATFI
ncbi:ribosomal rna assembly protein mis3, putative [Babesia caballi]|uniref:Ribosomal rna assembly protein mis3, putative n=1 Tax=Babesia caballi TaxID=5871 RepID=A0AAV4LUZ1_BABCB|nr:ribosomal rna assembly protein mis3, putative [Babesia caballi]